MADQVEEVKNKTDIVGLISEYLTLKKAGRNYKANCPFHGEKTPSFMVSPELQIYKCFGCDASGDCFTFLEKHEGMDFYEALKFLANRAGVKIIPINPGQASEKERLFSLSSLASKFYAYMLTNHASGKKALDYLTRERGLRMDTLKHFNIGFSPAFSKPLVNLLVNRKKYHPEELTRAGLTYFKGKEMVDRFGGRIIFPLYDHRGNCIGFSGRLLPGDPREENSGKYINSPDTPIYHKSKVLYGLNWTKEHIKADNSALIVEGELDLISLYQAGIKNVVAIKGSALTEEHVDLLLRFTPSIILALDADIAGNMAARRGIAQAYKKGLEIKVVRFTDFKDPDEAVRKNPESFRRSIDKAVNVWDYLLDEAFKKNDLASAEGKRKIGREVVPILASIDDSIMRAHYVGIVAKKLGVPESSVLTEIDKSKPEMEREEEGGFQKKDELKNRRQKLEEELLSVFFLLNPKPSFGDDTKRLIKTPLCVRVVGEYEKYLKGKKAFSVSEFGKGLPRELFRGFSEMILSVEEGEGREELEKEYKTLKKELEKLEVRDKMTALSKDIGSSQAQKEFSKLSKRLIELEEK